MKRLLVLLTIMVAIFGFTAGAFAVYPDPVCVNCKGDIRNIDCTTATGQVAGTCGEFDYDTPFWLPGATTGKGYCVASSMSAPSNYRAIFQICNCLQAPKFVKDQKVAVKMTILVDKHDGAGKIAGANGAYWSGITATPLMNFNPTAVDAAAACKLTAFTSNFGAPSFFLSDATTPGTPLAGAGCTFAAANKTTIITTPASAIALNGSEGPAWWIDIPPIRIDPAVLHNGETISVKIELYDWSVVPICPACVVTLCDCTIDVALVCCSKTTATTLVFPYFTSLTAGYWWNGIAISNPTGAAGTCTLTAQQMNGKVGTATVAVPANSMFVSWLETMTFAGTGLGASACYITASCNYGGAFGFAMMATDDHDSMGYLPWTVLP